MRRRLSSLFLCLLMSVSRAENVVYPRHPSIHDPQIDYALSLLRLALDKSGTSYILRQSALVMVQSRTIREIKDATGTVDVLWTMTTPEREAELLPIRIPIDRGLIGWRIALVHTSHVQQFHDVRALADLSKFTAGQMHDWPDTAILKQNGLRVETSGSYEGLFKQLARERIDYFPRSVIEIGNELAAHDDLPIALEPYLIIRYPTAFYFFVGRHRAKLALDIESGLEKALSDGSFEKLFQRHYGKLTNDLNLGKRRVLELENNLLPKETPLARKELWYHPANAK